MKILSLIVLAALAAAPAAAVEKVTNPTGDTVTATTATTKGRASITLKNDLDEVSVTVGSEFRHETTQATVEAQWIKYPIGAEPGGVFKLMASETATFEVSGEFVDPGVYETFIEATGKTGTKRYPVRITRTIKEIGANFLLEAKPSRIQLGVRDIFVSSSYQLRFTGRNATSEAVDVAKLIVGPILTGSAEATAQVAAPQLPTAVKDSCTGEIPAGQLCVFDIQLPPGLGPGSYSFDLLLPGRGGGLSKQTASVDIRASAWLAGVIIVLGVLLGAAVTDWRKTTRPIVDRRIEVARLREDAQKLAMSAGQSVVVKQAEQLVRNLAALDGEILDGKDVAAKVADQQARLALLARSDELLQAATQPTNQAANIFNPLVRGLSAALGAVEWKSEIIIARANALVAELLGFEALAQAARHYDDAAAELAPAVNYLGGDGQTTEWKAALRLRREAFLPIAPGAVGQGATTESRAKSLDDATDKLIAATAKNLLDKLKSEIKAAFQATPERKAELEALQARLDKLTEPFSSETIGEAIKVSGNLKGEQADLESAGTQLNLPTIPGTGDLIFTLQGEALQPRRGASLDELVKSRWVWDLISNLVALAGIASVGVIVLWMTNITWGSAQDILLAFLAGAGTRLSIGTIGQAERG